MILQVVFKEDMLCRDIEDLERRYQVQGIPDTFLLLFIQCFLYAYDLFIAAFLCRQVIAGVRSWLLKYLNQQDLY